MRVAAYVGVLGVGLALASVAASQGAVPPPPEARSVEVLNDGAPVFLAPREGAPRRGTVTRETRLPILGRVAGDGCSTGVWAQVGLFRFVCESHLVYRRGLPFGVAQPVVPHGEHLPYQYAFVRHDATPTYARLDDYDAGAHHSTLGEGFGVVVEGHDNHMGLPFVRTRRGLWIERDAVGFARGSSFRGVPLTAGGDGNVAWVRRGGAVVLSQRGGRPIRRLGPRDRVRVAGEASRGYLPLVDGGVVRAQSLHYAEPSVRPEAVASKERWLDVDVSEQVLTAYEGDRPVYSTLVSTGRPGRNLATPVGEFRVWVKLAYSDMDDLEREDLESNYAIERVPWVQYFEGANGLHAAFWHDDFGRRRSHGCVNLSPEDARWVFDFTSPRLPDGWLAVFPTEHDPGTLVRIRE